MVDENNKEILKKCTDDQLRKFIEDNYFKKVSISGSVLGVITINLVADKQTANKLMTHIKGKSLEIGKQFFNTLAENGFVVKMDNLHIGYTGGLVEPIRLLDIGKIITLYAQGLAKIQNETITLNTFRSAYDFFLEDFKLYFEELGLITFNEKEIIVDFYIDVRRTAYVFLITNHRMFKIRYLKDPQNEGADVQKETIRDEVELLSGENRPRLIHDPWIFRTNTRFICYDTGKTMSFNANNKIGGGTIEQDETIKNILWLKSNTLFLLTDKKLFIWPDNKPLEEFLLKSIARVEQSVKTTEKKLLFIPYKTKQAQIILHCPDKHEFNISPKEMPDVKEIISTINQAPS